MSFYAFGAVAFGAVALCDLFSGANTIIRSADRRFAEPLNEANLSRAHTDCHSNRIVP